MQLQNEIVKLQGDHQSQLAEKDQLLETERVKLNANLKDVQSKMQVQQDDLNKKASEIDDISKENGQK